MCAASNDCDAGHCLNCVLNLIIIIITTSIVLCSLHFDFSSFLFLINQPRYALCFNMTHKAKHKEVMDKEERAVKVEGAVCVCVCDVRAAECIYVSVCVMCVICDAPAEVSDNSSMLCTV